MNKYFIKTSIDKIELLHASSMSNIKSILNEYQQAEQFHEDEILFRSFVEDVLFKRLNEDQINAFLCRPYKDGTFGDYIEVTCDPLAEKYSIGLIKYDELFDLDKGFSTMDKTCYKFQLAVETPIINLITLYEGFIRLLIRTDCIDGNEWLIKDEQISLSQIRKLNFEEKDIRDFIIEAYCNSKLFGEKKRIRDIIVTLGIDCKDCEELIEDFEEIYFRRNMYVHGINKLTEDYLGLPQRVKKQWIAEDNKLHVLPEYFDHAFIVAKKIFLMILIKKCLYKEKNESDLSTISDVVYKTYYFKKGYTVARFAYKQLKKLEWINKIQRYFYFVNYMVCLKYTDKQELDVELKKWNTTTDAPIFQLAKKLIQEDYKNINTMIKSIYVSKDTFAKLSKEERELCLIREFIETWPLFLEYRKTEYYNELKIELKFLP